MTKILVAGATGYLGGYVAQLLKERGCFTRVLVRNRDKLKAAGIVSDEVLEAELTNRSSLLDCCKGMEIVFSSVGITRQKEGLSYLEVDYQANLNLLEEAKKSGVRKFVYVSVLHGKKLKDLKMCQAKEKLVQALKDSGLDYCIVRPTGYFSDMKDFYQMAEKGRIFLLAGGKHRMNPIHGRDLAQACFEAIENETKEVTVGGPETFTYNQIAKMAFSVAGKKEKVTYIPDLLIKWILFGLRKITSVKTYGPIEFFMTVLSMDMVAPGYGRRSLESFFEELRDRHPQ